MQGMPQLEKLVVLGISAMFVLLTLQGLLQGLSLMGGAEWQDSVDAMRPFWWLRTLTGIAMDIGISLLVVNLMKTSLPRRAA